MLKLVVDAGNSLIKIGIFKEKDLVELITFPLADGKEAIDFISKQNFSKIIASSVLSDSHSFVKYLKTISGIIFLSYNTPVPLVNLYNTPETLGMDRLAAATGAAKAFPQTNILIIDAGTCIKYDVVNARGIYLGGAISPGIRMRLQALNTFTEKLPLLQVEAKPFLIGNDTKSSMLSGVINAAIFEVEGFISEYKKSFPTLKVLLTGGDSYFFDKKLKNSIFALPNLVLRGLNEILDFNVK